MKFSQTLIQSLAIYQEQFANEKSTCDSFYSALAKCDHQFFNRENYTPGHTTASSFVVTPDNNFVLLIFHKTLQRWLQPGGHIDPQDKNFEDAAKRELLEETNITPPLTCLGLIDLDIHTIPIKNNLPQHLHFDLRFLFVSDKKLIKAGSDAYIAKWVSVANLTPDNTDESILRALRKTAKLLKK
jgi:8-oxo-dGTP pyrophosphatase MutT (NUDIX family)